MFLSQKSFLKVFAFLIFMSNNFFVVQAQQATSTPETTPQNTTQYNNTTILDRARKQCQAVIASGGISPAFDDNGERIFLPRTIPPQGGGGGQVAVYDVGAISRLSFLSSVSVSMEAYLKEANFGNFCSNALNAAKAIDGARQALRKDVQKIVDKNLTNPDAVIDKTTKKIVEDAVEKIQGGDTEYKEYILTALAKGAEPRESDSKFIYTAAEIESVASGKRRLDLNIYHDAFINGNNPVDQSIAYLMAVRSEVIEKGSKISSAAAWSGGIVPDTTCLKTKSGSDPELIDGNDPDCAESQIQPVIINQEKLKQIVNAPYNQAFSSSAQLGLDGALSNINTRINNGTLFSSNVGENFGSQGTAANGSLTDVEKIKNQLINPATSTPSGTVTLGIAIQQAVIDLYQSSTSSCIYLPVADRQTVIAESRTKKAELESYKTDLTKTWAQVVANPRIDYTSLFFRLSTDYSNKYSKTWLEELMEKAKEKASKCALSKPANQTTVNTP